MGQSPVTRPSLLIRIRDPRDREAWERFVEIYAPLIDHYGRKRGLQEADAADLAQEVLQVVASVMGTFEYDPGKGTFRGWLFTVTRNKLRRFLSRRGKQARGSGDTGVHQMLQEQADETGEQAEWEREYQQRLFAWAADKVQGSFREATWQAFWRTAVENEPAAEVAESLGMTVGAVYIARSRVLARLREAVQDVVGDEAQ